MRVLAHVHSIPSYEELVPNKIGLGELIERLGQLDKRKRVVGFISLTFDLPRLDEEEKQRLLDDIVGKLTRIREPAYMEKYVKVNPHDSIFKEVEVVYTDGTSVKVSVGEWRGECFTLVKIEFASVPVENITSILREIVEKVIPIITLYKI